MDVVVLGAGYAGVTLVRSLEDSLPADAEITLVDERETHLVQHLLHKVVREPTLAEQITVPLEDLFERASVRHGRVTGVDPDAGRVTLADGSLEYDVGAVCLGARTAYYDLPGVEEHATPLKRVSHAERIREEFHELSGDNDRVVVGGAGLSGIQVAGELAEMSTDEDGDTARSDEDGDHDQSGMAETDVSGTTDTASGTMGDSGPGILLLEQESSVAPSFPAPFREAVAEELTARGVTVRTGQSVERADGATISLEDGTAIEYDQFVWTGGIRGQEALASDRPRVRGTLRLGERTFGVGDAVRVVDANGTVVPASAQTAISQAEVAATNLKRLAEYELDGGSFEPRLARYTHDTNGWVVTIGDGTVAQVGSRVLRGRSARAIKTTIGAQYLGSIGGVTDAIEFVRDSLQGH